MFARTERLLLRPGWPEDAPALAAAIGDESIVRNLAHAPWPYGLAEAERFLARPCSRDAVSLLVFRRTHGAPQLIGSAGLGRTPDGDVELGYWIARPQWGLGYATEAGTAIVDLARNSLQMRRLSATHFLDNPASGRVLEKIGFRPTGIVARRFSEGRRAHAPSKLYSLDLDDTEVGGAVDAREPACRMLAA